MDLMENFLKDKLLIIEIACEDKVAARRHLLSRAANDRERQIWEILLRQEVSTRGSRGGNRKNITTKLKDETLLNAHAEWQKGRTKPGSVRDFARWWFKRQTKRDADDPDIKRIEQRLRDAQKRMAEQ